MKPRAVYRLSLSVVGVLSALNVGVAVWVVSRLRSPVSYNVRVIEPPTFPAAPVLADSPLPGQPSTNSLPSSLSLSSSFSSAPDHWSHPYHYMEVDGKPCAYLNGRYVWRNSRHAYGVVSDIFPERIYFSDGSYIENSKVTRSSYDTVSTGTFTASE